MGSAPDNHRLIGLSIAHFIILVVSMFPSGSNSGGDSNRRLDSAQVTSQDKSQQDRLLDQVLQQTQTLGSDESPLNSQELSALNAVAKRHGLHTLNLDIASELVQALFSLRWRSLVPAPNDMAVMARQVAESLLEHPHSKERLERLWNRLAETPQ